MEPGRRSSQPGGQGPRRIRDLAGRGGDGIDVTTGRSRGGKGRIARRLEGRGKRTASKHSAKQAKQDGEDKEPAKQRHEKPNQIERIPRRPAPVREAFLIQGRLADLGRAGSHWA